MRSPDQIDDLIQEDLVANRSIIARLERELSFHLDKDLKLNEALGCEHEPEKDGASNDRCRQCGYRWVR